MVRWRVFDRRVAPVARVLGSDLAGRGFLAIALFSVKPPALRSHTSGPGLVVPGAGIRGQTVSPARAALHYVRVFLDGRQRRFSSSLLSSAVCFAASVARSTRRSGLQISVVSRHSPFRLIGFFSEINGPHSHLINELRIIGIL